MGESGVKMDVNALCLLARDLVGNEESGETFRNFSKALCSGMFMCSPFICIISFKVRCRWNKIKLNKKSRYHRNAVSDLKRDKAMLTRFLRGNNPCDHKILSFLFQVC